MSLVKWNNWSPYHWDNERWKLKTLGLCLSQQHTCANWGWRRFPLRNCFQNFITSYDLEAVFLSKLQMVSSECMQLCNLIKIEFFFLEISLKCQHIKIVNWKSLGTLIVILTVFWKLGECFSFNTLDILQI